MGRALALRPKLFSNASMEHRPSERFRGYRPPGRRWEILKRKFAIGVLSVFVIASSYCVTRGLLIGEVPLFENDGFERVVRWETSRGRFIAYWLGWLTVDIVSAIGISALAARIRDIRNP